MKSISISTTAIGFIFMANASIFGQEALPNQNIDQTKKTLVTEPAQRATVVDSNVPANYTMGAPGDCTYADEDNISTLQESTLNNCAMECDNNDSCTSFIFNKINNKCILTDLLNCSTPQANNEQQIYYKKALNQNAAPGTVTQGPEITGTSSPGP